MRIRPLALLGLPFLCVGLLLAEPAQAAPQDAAAIRLADQAIQDDYLNTKFKRAETKLKKAIKLCGKDRCSSDVLARIYRDLGVVLIAGRKNGRRGRDAFARAVQTDPEIRLDPDLSTPEVEKAFVEVGGQGMSTEKEPEGEGEDSAVTLEEDEAEGAPEADAPVGPKKNYVSLSVQQDLLLHSRDTRACVSGRYTCFDESGEYGGPIYAGYGNEVTPGIGLATTRVLLGYERLVLSRLLVGARAGFAFGGGPSGTSEAGFFPFHGELRVAYQLVREALAENGLRPYAGFAIGVAEVSAKVDIDYFESTEAFQGGEVETLAGWRRTGKPFVAPVFGAGFGFGSASSVLLELRGQLMFGESAFAPAVSVGYAHGI